MRTKYTEEDAHAALIGYDERVTAAKLDATMKA